MPRSKRAWLIDTNKKENLVLLYVIPNRGKAKLGDIAHVIRGDIKEYYTLTKLVKEWGPTHLYTIYKEEPYPQWVAWEQYWEAKPRQRQRTLDGKVVPYNQFKQPKPITEEEAKRRHKREYDIEAERYREAENRRHSRMFV